MEKAKLNYTVDLFMVISFIVTAITGLIILFFLPEGVPRGGTAGVYGYYKAYVVNNS